MASQVYFNGDFYEAVEDTAAGESPLTDPDKWRKLEIPAIFQRFLIQAAYERLLPADGQNDKRRGERITAQQILEDTYFREQHQASALRGDRAEVGTR